MNYRALIFCLFCLAAAAEESAGTTEAAAGWERYKFLAQRNIFSRDQAGGGRNRSKQTEPSPAAMICLKGIVMKDGQLTAVLLNLKTNTVQVARAGDEVAGGQIASISSSLDCIEYAREGTNSAVQVGQALEANAAPVPVPAASPASPASPVSPASPLSAAGPKAADGSDGGASEGNAALERLRKKRQEELQK